MWIWAWTIGIEKRDREDREKNRENMRRDTRDRENIEEEEEMEDEGTLGVYLFPVKAGDLSLLKLLGSVFLSAGVGAA